MEAGERELQTRTVVLWLMREGNKGKQKGLVPGFVKNVAFAIEEIKLGKLEVLIAEGEIRGELSATCILTNLKTGEEYTLDFYLTLEDGEVEARLVTRKFWQFWE
jgi:hypothetical protein